MILHDPNNAAEQNKVFRTSLSPGERTPDQGLHEPAIAGTVWRENNKTADQYNKPGKFTAFCAYEWTANADFRNMHRNIFFKDCAKVPEMPFSSLNSAHPEDLWKWMDGQRKAGNELLAISHNANLSDGNMYPIDVDSYGRPIDAAWAQSRDRNERLIEIKQIKGPSETHPALSPTDEFASYEILSVPAWRPAGVVSITSSVAMRARLSKMASPCRTPRATTRTSSASSAPRTRTTRAPPTGRTTSTAATPPWTERSRGAWRGRRLHGLDSRFENPAGLTGVWAEENTRASIFDAMQRNETFAVSGPHIKLRFFGGWGIGRRPERETG